MHRKLFTVVSLSWLLVPVSSTPYRSEPLLPRELRPNTTACRCYPGNSCWPAPSVWATFNKTVGGRLVATTPLATVCHGDQYDEAACQNLRNEWYIPATHIESSSSIMAPLFANQSCDPFLPRDAPCVIGAYVRYAVDIRSSSDAQATLKFAKAHNIRLVIRNTAHDFLGKSTGPGALAIWTHNFKSIEVIDYSDAHYKGKALKVSAGTEVGEAFQKAHEDGLMIVGGTCDSVGLAGGYSQGGGHGYAASKLGLASDQTLEWEIVTPQGKILKASPSENPDLYWALGGGGGGTYGVVLSLTIKAYPDQTTSAANLTWTSSGISQDVFFEGIQAYVAALPTVLDAGAVSTWLNDNKSFSMSPAVGFGMTQKELDALHKPILEQLHQLNISYTYYSAEFPTFLDMYSAMNPYCQTALFQVGGRLIPRSTILDSTDDFVSALRGISDLGNTLISGVSFNVSKTPSVANAVNPAFREASVSVLVGMYYNYTNREQNSEDRQIITGTIVPMLADLIPGGGHSYLNEGDPFEPKWQEVFYGDNYSRLQQIKKKYDPEDVLYARTAVGSEAWTESIDGRLCRS
ncbi:putative alcohol oxidase [Hypomontagnella monticulosa]|nr:putative alcohol oxidase [Hypomontagnella monticulosa]